MLEFFENTGVVFHTLGEKKSGEPFELLEIPPRLLDADETVSVVDIGEGKVDFLVKGVESGPGRLSSAPLVCEYSFKSANLLKCILDRMLPLLYGFSRTHVESCQSYDWCRLWLTRARKARDDNEFEAVLVIDTETRGEQHLGMQKNEVDSPFSPQTEFFTSSLNDIFSNVLSSFFKQAIMEYKFSAHDERADLIKDSLFSRAAYLATMNFLIKSKFLPEIIIAKPFQEPVDVHLVVDLGNSRSCGMLVETKGRDEVEIERALKLRIRNLSRPNEFCEEPTDTNFEFCAPPLQCPDFEPGNFRWNSPLRIGEEAMEQSFVGVGRTGLSSPKRYLWDMEPGEPWFCRSRRGEAKMIRGTVLDKIDLSGDLRTEESLPAFTPNHAPSAMMTPVMLEILEQAYSQINSFEYRKYHGSHLSPRRLASLTMCYPCGMLSEEKEIYVRRVRSALRLFCNFHKIPQEKCPELHFELDEANAVQLSFLFGESRKFRSKMELALETMGACSAGEEGGRLLRMASIDIGGGTSDLMICDYFCRDNQSGSLPQLESRPLFSDGISVAGDHLAYSLIVHIILRQIFDSIKSDNLNFSLDHLERIVGTSSVGVSDEQARLKAAFSRYILVPMAHYILGWFEEKPQESIELDFKSFFSLERSSAQFSRLTDYFDNKLKDGGFSFRLIDSRFRLDPNLVEKVLRSAIKGVLRDFSHIIGHYGCDVLLLGGRVSSLPIIRDILLELCPVPSSRIVELGKCDFGSWYPFVGRNNMVRDPKTTCVVGATIWLITRKLHGLKGFRLKSGESRVVDTPFIGLFNPQEKRMPKESVMFYPSGPSETVFTISGSPVFIGFRRLSTEHSEINPLYELTCADVEEPFDVRLKLCGNDTIKLSGDKESSVKMRLRTFVEKKHWTDTGGFELGSFMLQPWRKENEQ